MKPAPSQLRTYSRANVVSFRSTKERFGGLSNMAPGYPLLVNGVQIRTVEALYQACRFPSLPDVQRMIIEEKSPMTAKMLSKPYRSQSRPDWLAVRVKIMRWCLRLKLAQNWKNFGELLYASGDQPIVEDSTKDDFWGAKMDEDQNLVGQNILGRLLMELREHLRSPKGNELRTVPLPDIKNFVLCGEQIAYKEISERPFPDENADMQTVSAPIPQLEHSTMTSYPKRLIEVDLPIKRISAHARREKSIRHGHISTLHIWWARRPLAACRAVICAALWPDPADKLCPAAFRKQARELMLQWTTHERQNLLSAESCKRFEAARQNRKKFDDAEELRGALLDFIADFANWDNSTVREYLDTSRALTQAAHVALGGAPDTRPLVVDPFAGGGSIPLEALRVGADSFASDLNPVAILLNTVIENVSFSEDLIVSYVEVAEKIKGRLTHLWPDNVFAKFWSRTIQCEGPSCGVQIPLIRNGLLAKRFGYALKFERSKEGHVQVEISPISSKEKRPILNVIRSKTTTQDSTCKNGSVTCPVCNYSHKQSQVARQTLERGFGRRLTAIGEILQNSKSYRSPSIKEESAHIETAFTGTNQIEKCLTTPINSKRPSPAARGMSAVTRYGYTHHQQLFSAQQLHLLETIRVAIDEELATSRNTFRSALQLLLAITLDRLASFQNTFCRWAPKGEHPVPPFGKNGFPMIWDYVEASPFGDSAGSWDGAIEWVRRVLEHVHLSRSQAGTVERGDSQSQLLPNDSVEAWVTDPPYYDSYPYADLSDFFYPILRASLGDSNHPISYHFSDELTPKDQELVLQPSRVTKAGPKDHEAYRVGMTKAFSVGRIVTKPGGICVIVFANKSTSGWEALLSSVCDAGWVVTGSWPIDTERESRSAGQARLQSSVHLVCRPRKNPDGSVRTDEIGDWRDVLQALPIRIHEWMPRLADEGVVGADAIFACLGPALEIFSRYSRVEKASGEAVTLKEYLEQVWAAVAKEALTMIFTGADTTGFEEDARLTAMWLWTLNAGNTDATNGESAEEEDADDESEGATKKAKTTGFVLEYDAARKIAQGLGAHLEDLGSLVEISGETARLLPVGERAHHLFGKDEGKVTPARKKKAPQLDLFKVLEQADEGGTTFGETKVERHGETVLDRIHQSMILFAAGRSEALKRFIVEDGAGRDQRFWRLAQALSALYPSHTEEKRWVDGVLARKKGLGF
jgi:ribA/ribD-fused uncharacterized protein